MSYFAGIDLHKRYLTLCVLDLIGNVVVQHRRLTTDGLFAVLAELDAPITVAVEATLHWAWLHDRLVAQGYGVQVADPGQVKLISRARCKTDPIDAKKLADLLRSNLLPAIWVPDPATRANRKLLRGYSFLVRSRTRLKNRVHAYLAEINLASPATDLFGKQGRIWMDSLTLPDEVRFQVDNLLELLDQLELRIRKTAKRIEQRVDITPEAQLLLPSPASEPRPPCLSWPRSEPSTGFQLPTISPASPASCPPPEAPVGKPPMALCPGPEVHGSVGLWSRPHKRSR